MVQAGFCQRMAKTEIISSNGVEEKGRCKMDAKLKAKAMTDDQLDNVAGGIGRDVGRVNKSYQVSMEPNTTPQTLPQMKQEDMPLHKLMNGSNDSRQPVDKILLDGQTLKSSELKTYSAWA